MAGAHRGGHLNAVRYLLLVGERAGVHAPEREQRHGGAAGHHGHGTGGQNNAVCSLVNNLAFTDIEIIRNTLNCAHARHCSPVFPLRYGHSGDGGNFAELLLRHVVLRPNPSDVLGYAHVSSFRCDR